MSEGFALEKPPSEIQIIGGMHLVGGIFNLVASAIWFLNAIGIVVGTFGLGFFVCCIPMILFPVACLELYSGYRHLSSDHRGLKQPTLVGIAEIGSILGCNVFPVVFGVLTFVLMRKPEVAAYYARTSAGN